MAFKKMPFYIKVFGYPARTKNLDIAPCDIELSSAEKELGNKIGGELRLKVTISKISKNYHFILIYYY